MGWNVQDTTLQSSGTKTYGVLTCETGELARSTSIEHDGHGLLVMRHVVGQHVGLCKASAVLALAQRNGRQPQTPKF